MAVELILPALGESVTEGTVTHWLKKVGDRVLPDEPVVEVSTDKVDTEVPAPAGGIIIEIRYGEDEIVPVGTVLALIDTSVGAVKVEVSGETVGDTAGDPATGGAGTETVAGHVGSVVTGAEAPEPEGSTDSSESPDDTARGFNTPETDAANASRPAPTPVEAAVPQDSQGSQEFETPQATASRATAEQTTQENTPKFDYVAPRPAGEFGDQNEQGGENEQTFQSEQSGQNENMGTAQGAEPRSQFVVPLVRKLAADLGVDLASVKGTGVGGRIRKEDVTAAGEALRAAAAATLASSSEADLLTLSVGTGTSSPTYPTGPDGQRRPIGDHQSVLMPQLRVPGTSQPMSPIQIETAERLVESLQNSAQLSATAELDLTGIEPELRLPSIVKAAAAALATTLSVNASISDNTLTYHREANIGIACETEFGLIVPVIHLIEAKSTATIADEIVETIKSAKLGIVSPRQLSGGTFTIVDNSATGALLTTAVINQPQVAILSIGAAGQRPKVIPDAFGVATIVVRTLAYATLTYDRRAVSPADAGAFLEALTRALA